ncbi:Rhodanese-like domain-containing protein [Blastococcus mobilis]|uniref:Rhodanese-like domain-containing protein n=1 Tax=Blastococcus mobilis TaxID=1938746 RepID=A0A238WZ84_9ACTN|nr:rhodanese-like domain-containing protein [Blastococcus mobilis]SNR51762.1 Rhodanese-like domain-containing protein [Blastococcus mobilis]
MIPEIDQNAFAARLAEGGSLVVDVREAREYRPGHVPGATTCR